MSYLVMQDYLENLRENINEYMKIMLGNNYSKNICDKFISSYIESMYIDTYSREKYARLQKEVLKKLEAKYDLLLSSKNNSINKRKIDITYTFFKHVIFLEREYDQNGLDKLLGKIDKLKEQKFRKYDLDYKDKLINKIKENDLQRKQFFEKYQTSEFYVGKQKYNDDLYQIDLKYNIKFPMIYSNIAIKKSFNSGIINEDKLFIEYILTSILVIEDIEKKDTRQDYLVDFAPSLFEKKQKLNRLLNIIRTFVTQDRFNLIISFSDFTKYKEDVYLLIKSGFKFAINIDDTFVFNELELSRLTLFSYVIISKDLNCYSNFKNSKKILKNLIEK